MREELLISGRENVNIDPILHIWHWQIPLYLFLGGLAAGILFFAAYFTIQGKEKQFPTAVKIAPFIAPIALILGLVALFIDLTHKLYFWQLYVSFNIESPMSWGAWILMAITPLSLIWCAVYIKEIFPKWDWKFAILYKFEALVKENMKLLAWVVIFLAVLLGVYTGILLSAFNARPLWNTSLLGPLFLVSGLSTGAAAIMWMSKNKIERKVFSKIDLILIAVELFFIIHLFMGFMASSKVQIEAAELFLGGEYTVVFWVFVVGLGLVVPAILELLELFGKHVPINIPTFLIILGGLIFRFIMVEAGQVTRYLY